LTREDLKREFENELLSWTVTASRVEEKDENLSKARNQLLAVVVILLVVVVIIVMGVIAGTRENDDRPDDEGNKISPLGDDHFEPPMMATDTPMLSPRSAAPTPMPTLSGDQEDLLTYLKSISTNSSQFALEEDPSSPQCQAFLWLGSWLLLLLCLLSSFVVIGAVVSSCLLLCRYPGYIEGKPRVIRDLGYIDGTSRVQVCTYP
jgi:hypothetical protein